MHFGNLHVVWTALESGLIGSLRQIAWLIWPAVIFFLGILGYAKWKSEYARRWPFENETRILRSPGESARNELEKLSENMLVGILSGLLFVISIPALADVFYISAVAVIWPAGIHYWRLAHIIGAITGSAIGVWFVSRKVVRYWNMHLGYLGERFVADRLELLDRSLWRAYHDIPCARGNIDHVAIGPGGVLAIETKTRRKWRGEDNGHRIKYDGQDLAWPKWGIQNQPLDQAERNAHWLTREIKDRTGIQVDVTPLVTVPGWFVDYEDDKRRNPQHRAARVVQTSSIANFIQGGRRRLNEDQIERIAVFMDARCRNIRI